MAKTRLHLSLSHPPDRAAGSVRGDGNLKVKEAPGEKRANVWVEKGESVGKKRTPSAAAERVVGS